MNVFSIPRYSCRFCKVFLEEDKFVYGINKLDGTSFLFCNGCREDGEKFRDGKITEEEFRKSVKNRWEDEKNKVFSMALSAMKQGWTVEMVQVSGSKTKNFHKFLRNIKLTTHLLLDNARIHHATDSCRKLKLSTIAKLAKKKKIKLVYLPGYSPKLNPVEKCFSVIKNYYRQQRPRTERKLRKVIKEAITKIQQLDLTKTFKSCFGL